MDNTWIRQLQVQVCKRKRTFQVPGYGQSRRGSGMMHDRDDAVSGFKHLCIYIDAGLVGKEQQIAKILGVVDGQIFGYEHYDHTRWPMFFGIESDKLTTSGPVRVHTGIRGCDWEKIVKQHLLPKATLPPTIIPRLHNSEIDKTRSPDRCDLGLFLCHTPIIYRA
ncbi:MAG: hypothetical protein ACOYL3_27615 [Desulfuromonadaceae bacterium]